MTKNAKAIARLEAFQKVMKLIESPLDLGEVTKTIGALYEMSRSPRWNEAVSSYLAFVEGEYGTENVRWAIVQGGIYFGYNTEGLM